MGASSRNDNEPDSLGEILRSVGLPHREADDRDVRRSVAQAFSGALAVKLAEALRPRFPGIKPDADGSGQESKARSAKGYKKLDVNYSTPELGLGLGISIKTVNSVDPKTGRYDHNYSRIDTELCTEAIDYHKRQPYAVLIAVFYLPVDSCETGTVRNDFREWVSDFARAMIYFRPRGNRRDHLDDADKFERFFVALCDLDDKQPNFGRTRYFDVFEDPPRRGYPAGELGLSFAEFIEAVTETYDRRNKPGVTWAEEP